MNSLNKQYALVFDFRPEFADTEGLHLMRHADAPGIPDEVRRLVKERLDAGHEVYLVQARAYSMGFVYGLIRALGNMVLLVGPEMPAAKRAFMSEYLTVRDLVSK